MSARGLLGGAILWSGLVMGEGPVEELAELPDPPSAAVSPPGLFSNCFIRFDIREILELLVATGLFTKELVIRC